MIDKHDVPVLSLQSWVRGVWVCGFVGFGWFSFVHYCVGILQVRLQHIVENLQHLDHFFSVKQSKLPLLSKSSSVSSIGI